MASGRSVSPVHRASRVVTPRGFTLVELLIVVLIIAVLVGITLPALASARRTAWGAACLSNQKQIGLALTMYADTYRKWVLREGLEDNGLWPEPLKSAIIARIPWAIGYRPFLDQRVGSDEYLGDLFQDAPYVRDPARRRDGHPIHYVANGFNFDGPDDVVVPTSWRQRRGPVRLVVIPRPAETMYLTCFADDPSGWLANQWANPANDRDVAQQYDISAPAHMSFNSLNARIAPKRHDGGSNVLFLDGHAKRVAFEQVVDVNSWDDGWYGYVEP